MFEIVYKMTGGDEVSHYDIILDKDYTVRDFINCVNEYSNQINNFGDIIIYDNDRCKWYSSEVEIGKGRYKYKYGKLLDELPDCILSKKVLSAHADGGWGMMDYSITIQSYKPPLSFEEHMDKEMKILEAMLDDILNE